MQLQRPVAQPGPLVMIEPGSCDLNRPGPLADSRMPVVLKVEVDAAGQRQPDRDRVLWPSGVTAVDEATKGRLAACRFRLPPASSAISLRHGLLLVMVDAPERVEPPGTRDRMPVTEAALAASAARPAPAMVQVRGCAASVDDYPAQALRMELTGVTRVRFEIGSRGEMLLAQVRSSSGYDLLDVASLRSLARCQFKPGTDVNGKPVGGATDVEYRWKIEETPPPPTQAVPRAELPAQAS